MNGDAFVRGEGVLVSNGVAATVVFTTSGEAEDVVCIAMVGVLPTGMVVSRIGFVFLEQDVINVVKTNEAAIISKTIE